MESIRISLEQLRQRFKCCEIPEFKMKNKAKMHQFTCIFFASHVNISRQRARSNGAFGFPSLLCGIQILVGAILQFLCFMVLSVLRYFLQGASELERRKHLAVADESPKTKIFRVQICMHLRFFYEQDRVSLE